MESRESMESCRHCNSKKIIKIGHKHGVQKWRCNECGKYQGEIDRREKYSDGEREMAIELYIEGCGFRRIARILSSMYKKFFRWQTVVLWIKKTGEKLSDEIHEKNEEIQLVEMDELHTFIKKRRIESEYGLLLIGTNSVLLRLKSAMQKERR